MIQSNRSMVDGNDQSDCEAVILTKLCCLFYRKFSQLFSNQCTTVMELNGNQGQRPLFQSKRCPTKVL